MRGSSLRKLVYINILYSTAFAMFSFQLETLSIDCGNLYYEFVQSDFQSLTRQKNFAKDKNKKAEMAT
ncbi:hypothetical protein BpHYR1_041389, partial [Brachionus plicatilis]